LSKKYIVATVLYCALIWGLSSTSKPSEIELPFMFEGMDKAGHLILYAGLAAVVSVGIRRAEKPATPWFQCFVPILFAAFYGLTDEIHQIFVPMRQFDLADLMADTAGAALIQCFLCYRWWQRGGQLARTD